MNFFLVSPYKIQESPVLLQHEQASTARGKRTNLCEQKRIQTLPRTHHLQTHIRAKCSHRKSKLQPPRKGHLSLEEGWKWVITVKLVAGKQRISQKCVVASGSARVHLQLRKKGEVVQLSYCRISPGTYSEKNFSAKRYAKLCRNRQGKLN